MLRYFVNDVECSQEDFEVQLEDAVRTYVENNYDEILDDSYEPYKIGDLTFYASQVLRELDPIAYHCAAEDYISSEYEDQLYAFEDEIEQEISGVDFRTEEVEEDD